MYFSDRSDAGKRLADTLNAYADQKDAIILALPRGGVPVAFEVAQRLSLPLDLMLVRKLGAPGNGELAMGAIAIGNVMVLNDDVIQHLFVSPKILNRTIEKEKAELMRRNNIYREGRPAPGIKDKTVILVDDGMATGANMRAAVQAARKQDVVQIIVAVPVASASAYDALCNIADGVICLDIPKPFYGVGHFYRNFSQTSDEAVITLLKQTSPKRRKRKKASEPQSA